MKALDLIDMAASGPRLRQGHLAEFSCGVCRWRGHNPSESDASHTHVNRETGAVEIRSVVVFVCPACGTSVARVPR